MTLTAQFALLLQELHNQCSDIRGTVIATSEGFILAAAGLLNDESAAATSVHITQVIEQHLSLLQPSSCREVMIWTDEGLWYIMRLPDEHVLMTLAGADCSAGMLRLVTRVVDESIAAIMAQARAEVMRLGTQANAE